MKKYLNLLPICALALSAFAPLASAATYITDWTSYTSGTSGTASGTLGGVTVTFNGDTRDLQNNHTTIFNHIGHASGQTFFTPNLPVSDAIGTWGDPGSGTNTITFSSPVQDPILWIASLGRGGNWSPIGSIQTFTFNTSFALVSSLYMAEGEGPGSNPYQMTQSGFDLIGQEGHGTLQFSGLISSISWTSDLHEESAYFQVGYETAAIPEPSTYAAMFGALALAGTIYWKRARRVTAAATA